MTPRYFDTHGHINFPDYDADREAAIKRAQELEIGIINVGTDFATSKSGVELAEQHKDMWATVGIHPTDTLEEIDFTALKELAMNPKVVAIGECGLDYFHSKPEDIARQKDIFEKQIALANEIGKPLMLHVRNGKTGGSAYQEALSILKAKAKVRANFHFFAGTLQDLKDIIAGGYGVSFTGVLTFTKDYDELIKTVPLEKVMSETDCPFVSPAPYRGKRNEPSYVIEVVKAIARIRREDEEQVREQLVKNAKEFFDLK